MRGATLARGCDARPPAPSTSARAGRGGHWLARARKLMRSVRVQPAKLAPQFGERPGKWHWRERRVGFAQERRAQHPQTRPARPRGEGGDSNCVRFVSIRVEGAGGARGARGGGAGARGGVRRDSRSVLDRRAPHRERRQAPTPPVSGQGRSEEWVGKRAHTGYARNEMKCRLTVDKTALKRSYSVINRDLSVTATSRLSNGFIVVTTLLGTS